jgi:hypothetical protein
MKQGFYLLLRLRGPYWGLKLTRVLQLRAIHARYAMQKSAGKLKSGKVSLPSTSAQCTCGAVRLEIDVPAFWAWHDHSAASRLAQGCAYATYIGCWKSKVRVLAGADFVSRFEDREKKTARSFCSRCGTPLFYERASSKTMINIPRGLFTGRTGREPRYHLNIEQQADWGYFGEALAPLKNYPGVFWTKPRRIKKDEETAIWESMLG